VPSESITKIPDVAFMLPNPGDAPGKSCLVKAIFLPSGDQEGSVSSRRSSVSRCGRLVAPASQQASMT
jgi:hypothetical protein